MQSQMDQGAIDQLFRAAKDQTGTGRSSPAPVSDVVPLDWTRTAQLSAEQLRAVTALHDGFARHASHNLGAWLRSGFTITAAAVEQLTYDEFISRFEEPAYCAAMRIGPVGALMATHMEISLAPPLVDLLLGGKGQAGVPAALTAIEEAILRSVMENVARELSIAWAPAGLDVQFERRYVLQQMMRLLPGSERTLCLDFEISMDCAKGSLNFSIPNVATAAMLARLSAEGGRRRRSSVEARQRMQHLASDIAFGASLQLPAVRMQAAALAALQPGDVLVLPMPVATPAMWMVDGEALFAGRAGRKGEHRAAHLLASMASGEAVRGESVVQ